MSGAAAAALLSEGGSASDRKKLEVTYSLIETLIRKMQQSSSNPPPDNSTYSVFFLHLNFIKIKFKMNNYKFSEGNFKWIAQQFANETYEPSQFPMSFRVTLAYYKGRKAIQ